MPQNDLVAIVIPAYNCQKYINISANSCINQDYDNVEVIICDDCSTDGTAREVARLQKRNHLLVNKTNIGASASRNKGIEHATKLGAKYIHFFDGDDVAEPNMISSKLHLFKNNLVGVVYSDYYNMNDDGTIASTEVKPCFDRDRLLESNYISMISMARTECINNAGGLNEHLTFGEDWLLWQNITRSKIAVRVPEPLFSYRMNPDSQTRKIDWQEYQLDMQIITAQKMIWDGTGNFAGLACAQNNKAKYMFCKRCGVNE